MKILMTFIISMYAVVAEAAIFKIINNTNKKLYFKIITNHTPDSCGDLYVTVKPDAESTPKTRIESKRFDANSNRWVDSTILNGDVWVNCCPMIVWYVTNGNLYQVALVDKLNRLAKRNEFDQVSNNYNNSYIITVNNDNDVYISAHSTEKAEWLRNPGAWFTVLPDVNSQ